MTNPYAPPEEDAQRETQSLVLRRILAAALDLCPTLVSWVLILAFATTLPPATVLGLLFFLLWRPFFETRITSTPGKALMGLRVIRRGGGSPDFIQSLKRTWSRALYLVILPVVAWSSRAQPDQDPPWDAYANTRVIHVNRPLHGRSTLLAVLVYALFATTAALSLAAAAWLLILDARARLGVL